MKSTRHETPRWVIMTLFLSALLGCGEVVEDQYGRLRGHGGKASVNGTAVLGNMFTQLGCKVRRWTRMSPKLERADVIIWFPDSFESPNIQQRAFVDQWLQAKPGRSLVYVGRGFDAEIPYWDKASSLAPPQGSAEYKVNLQTAQDEHEMAYEDYVSANEELPEKQFGGWFTVSRRVDTLEIDSLAGPWARGIDPSRVRIELRNRYDIPELSDLPPGAYEELIPQFEELLVSEDELIVTRVTRDEWVDSQVLVVTNGSFLLNYALVNHEHRKLAWRLVHDVVETAMGGEEATVVFLESGKGGPPVFENEPNSAWASGFKAFASWPLGVILLHLIAIGVVYCFSRFPTFGKLREFDRDRTADFGIHVSAVGQHLERTDDVHFAMAKVGQYLRNVKNLKSQTSSRSANPPNLDSTSHHE